MVKALRLQAVQQPRTIAPLHGKAFPDWLIPEAQAVAGEK